MFYASVQRRMAVFLCAAVLVGGVQVFGAEDMSQTLIKRISKSQDELASIEADIAKQSRELSRQLKHQEEQISSLRAAAANAQRLMDEQLLGLDQLQLRVEKWQTQSTYQTHLLNAYVESAQLTKGALSKVDGEVVVSASVVELAVNEIKDLLQPQWAQESLVTQQGHIRDMPVLSVGPVELAYDAGGAGGPVLRRAAGESFILDAFNQKQLDYLNVLHDQKTGYLVFDPSLGNAYELQNNDDKLMSHIGKGGIWAIPIVVFGFLSLLIAVLKAVQLFRLPNIDLQLPGKIAEILAEGAPRRQGDAAGMRAVIQSQLPLRGSAQAKLTDIALDTPMSQHRDDLLVAYLMEFKHRLERNLGIVATSAAIAPLLGLLGTVSGMISTFKLMTIFGSGDASTVSGGISEALVTTELGLIVAIPSLVVSALLTRKIRSYHHKLETYAIKLSKIQFDS